MAILFWIPTNSSSIFIPPNSYQGLVSYFLLSFLPSSFLLPSFLPSFLPGFLSFLKFYCSTGYLVASLMMLRFFSNTYLCFGKVFVHIFCPLLGGFLFYLLSCEGSLHILNISPLYGILQISLPLCGLCYYFLSNAFPRIDLFLWI
jgi:hypothetical protein